MAIGFGFGFVCSCVTRRRVVITIGCMEEINEGEERWVLWWVMTQERNERKGEKERTGKEMVNNDFFNRYRVCSRSKV